MKCKNCGNVIEEKYIWCPNCGTKRPKGKEDTQNNGIINENVSYCSNCGSKVTNDYVFCKECGSKVNETSKIEEKKIKNIKKVTYFIWILMFLFILFGGYLLVTDSCNSCVKEVRHCE